MLSQADLQVIQTVFGKTTEELSGAISSTEEVTLGLALKGKVYTPEEAKALEVKSQDAWIQIGVKKMAHELEVELGEGEKDVTIIASKLRAKVDEEFEEKYKDQTPDEKLAQSIKAKEAIEEQYKALHRTFREKEVELKKEQESSAEYKKTVAQKEFDNNMLSYFPEKLLTDRGDALLISKNAISSEEIDGTTYYSINGERVLAADGIPADLKTTVQKLSENKGWVKGVGKKGEDDKKGYHAITNMSDNDAMAALEKRGVNPMSPEGSKQFSEMTRDYEE